MQFFTVKLFINPPFLTQKTGAIAVYLDAQPLLDNAGNPIIPGSLVKGCFYDVLKYLGVTEQQLLSLNDNSSSLQNIPNSDDPLEMDRQPKLFHFSTDWHYHNAFRLDTEQSLSIDDKTHTVSDGGLIFEQVIQSEQSLIFEGTIYTTKALDDIDTTAERLTRAFSHIPALGGNKRVGFGRIEKAEVTAVEKAVPSLKRPTAINDNSLGLTLSPQWAMCFVKPSRHRIDTVETEHFIPGGAIKGAWFEALKSAGIPESDRAWKLLDKATVTHALLSESSNTRPAAIPKTWASVKQDGQIQYADLWDEPQLFETQADGTIAEIAFSSDWKGDSWVTATQEHGLLLPNIDVRVRHQYDQDRRASKESDLFLEETLSADQQGDWRCNIHFVNEDGAPQERQQALDTLFAAVAEGLPCVGRKATPIAITRIEAAYALAKSPQKPKQENTLRLTLQSDARLFSEEQIKTFNDTQLMYDETKLQQLYQDSLQALFQQENAELTIDAIELKDFACEQCFVGGNRWRKHLAGQQQEYAPEVFTRAGSTFLLHFAEKDHKAIATIAAQWMRLRLPQLPDRSEEKFTNPFRESSQDSTRTTPWTRRNGFGQVAIVINTTGEPS